MTQTGEGFIKILKISSCIECPLYVKEEILPCNHPHSPDWKAGWNGASHARHAGCPLSVHPLTLIPTEGSMEQ